MERSSVVDSQSGGSVIDNIRTSSGTFLAPNQDETLAAVQMRVAELAMLPQENQEALQVLHYGLSEKYGAHMDTFFDARHIGENDGGQRIATALMFLNEPDEGGETVFPNVPASNEGPGWSACARDALAHRPKTGDLILFWSLTPSGEIDPGTTHTACPVIRGEKWSAPLWIRQVRSGAGASASACFTHSADAFPAPLSLQGAFQPNARRAAKAPNGQLVTAGEACVDLHPECVGWAASGECKRNAGFMVGDTGHCRAACKACPYPTRIL